MNLNRNAVSLDLFNALSDKTRLSIVQELYKGERSCSEMISMFKMSKSTFSHHTKILVRSGIISFRREGRFIYFSLNKDLLETTLSKLITGSD